ncbi:MAG: hypothetical protein OEY89_10500, partial [Gammaproteobacteria bacterium]|nr:hypothetical protein [Gammaproteobacteria bacterium]
VQSRTIINDVLDAPDFHKKEVVKGWRLKKTEADEEQSDKFPGWIIWFIRLLESITGDDNIEKESNTNISIANLIEVFLWVVFGSLVIYFIYKLLKHYDIITLPSKTKSTRVDLPATNILFGLNINKNSIPDDVRTETLALWNAGQSREAISLLYRSTLSLLIHKFSFRFLDGNTEKECAEIVRKSNMTELSNFVLRVTAIWQLMAYAHKPPKESDVFYLCDKWASISSHEE